jgi:hypothetical protein
MNQSPGNFRLGTKTAYVLPATDFTSPALAEQSARSTVNTLTKLAAGLVGQLKPREAAAPAAAVLRLPVPERTGGIPLLDALAARRSDRRFRSEPLPLPLLSTLLWSANGINRSDTGGRTAPSAMNAQDITVYSALAMGVYVYDPRAHSLNLVADVDARRVTGYRDFVDDAPLDLIFVADYARHFAVPQARRGTYAAVSAGAVSQNVYLFCASAGLSTVVRGWFNRDAIAKVLGLGADQEVLLTQTVGYAA